MKLFELLNQISILEHPSTGVPVFYEFEDGELHAIENARFAEGGIVLSSTIPIAAPVEEAEHDHSGGA